MIAIGRVVPKSVDIHGPAGEAGLGAPVREDGLDLGSLFKPLLDGPRLFVGVCIKIDLSGKALIQPLQKRSCESPRPSC